jgi:hypothetical protein
VLTGAVEAALMQFAAANARFVRPVFVGGRVRVLFISAGQYPDYLCDMVFHGLRSEFGADAVDVQRCWHMYANEFEDGRHDRSKLYGRGFTIFGLLPSDHDVDRTDIERKIRTRYFDFIIYGSIHRCITYMNDVLMSYPPDRVLFLDGEDELVIRTPLLGRGIYFKRELAVSTPGVLPVQFAIPEERIGTVDRKKNKPLAFIDPRDPKTYIYNDEAAYYSDYGESLFGITMKKGGWDCLRHYEIMANGCIPWFLGLEQCPALTMTFLPKFELTAAKKMLEKDGIEVFDTPAGKESWAALQRNIETFLKRHCTTRAMARYVLSAASAISRQDGLLLR